MSERDLIQQLDQALSGAIETGPEVTALLRVAAVVRALPDAEFRKSLKQQLMYRAIQIKETQPMTTPSTWLRPGLRSLTSYLHAPSSARLMDFLTAAFGARELMRVPRPDGTIMHGELRIGDTTLELSEDPPAPFDARPVALHFYAPNVDDIYHRAIQAGATSMNGPTEREYGDREAGIIDPAGNYWYLATHHGPAPIPEGLHSVTPYLQLRGAAAFLDFLEHAFAAHVIDRVDAPDHSVVHAKARIGDSILEMTDARGSRPVLPASLHLYSPDVDHLYRRALAAGATSISAPADQPYGDRYAGVIDPFGNHWYLATHL